MYVNWTFRPQWEANQARALINVTLSTTTTTITIATTIITITASTTIIDIATINPQLAKKSFSIK